MTTYWIEETSDGKYFIMLGNKSRFECIANAREIGDESTALIVAEADSMADAERILDSVTTL